MGFATGCIKFVIFFLNILFLIAGLAITILGIVAKVSMSKSNIHAEGAELKAINTVIIAIIIIGVVVTVISFFGCCGAIKEDICLLNTYGGILLIIFIIQVALGTFAFIKLKKEGPKITKELQESLENYWKNYEKDVEVKKFVDNIQTLGKCCGVTGPDTWSTNSKFPETCCENQAHCTAQNAYQIGCLKRIIDEYMPHVKAVGIAVLVIAAIELLGGIFGICLAHSIANNRKYYT